MARERRYVGIDQRTAKRTGVDRAENEMEEGRRSIWAGIGINSTKNGDGGNGQTYDDGDSDGAQQRGKNSRGG